MNESEKNSELKSFSQRVKQSTIFWKKLTNNMFLYLYAIDFEVSY